MTCKSDSSDCKFPALSSQAYAIAAYLNTRLSADDMAALGAFLTALGDLLALNSVEKSKK